LNLGEVRKTEKSLVEQYKVEKFPRLIVLTTEGKQVTYEGALDHKALFSFLKPHAKMPQQQQQSSSSSEERSAPPPPPPEPVFDVKVEVTDQETFEAICATKNCIIAFLDPANSEADTQKSYMDVLTKAQEKHKKIVNFLWMDGLKQTYFTETFYLQSGFPAAILYNHKKKVVIPYVGSFNEEAIGDFVDRISIGGAIRGAIQAKETPKVLSSKKKDEL